MKINPRLIKILGLTNSQRKILEAVAAGYHSPTTIAQQSKVSRPTAYKTLLKLKNRALVFSTTQHGIRSWQLASAKKLEDELFQSLRQLHPQEATQTLTHHSAQTAITVYQDPQAIAQLLPRIIKQQQGKRIQIFQGDITDGWKTIFSQKQTEHINQLLKDCQIVVDCIMPDGWVERHLNLYDQEWASSYEGRSAAVYEIAREFFAHHGEIWVYDQSVYLVSLSESLVIEVRNNHIQKMLLAMCQYIQQHAKKIDVNERIRLQMAR